MGLWFSTHPGGIRLYRRPYFPVSLSFQVQLSLLGSLLLIFFSDLFIFLFICVCVFCLNIYLYTICMPGPTEAGRRQWIPWNCSYRGC